MTYFKLGLTTVAIIILIALPQVTSLYFIAFMLAIFKYTTLSVSWNMLSGYTGYLSLGHSLFFGLGGYTFAMFMTKSNLHWLPSLILSGLIVALIGLMLGFILLTSKIRIAYFAMITLGLNEVIRVLVTNSDTLGGGSGIMLPPIPSASLAYYIMLVIVLTSLLITYVLDRTSMGLGLKGILQDEEAASATGVHTAKLKISVLVLSAFFPGMMGGVVAWNWSYIDPIMAFDLFLSFNMVIMATIGGIGTLWGPVLGACFLTSLIELLSTNIQHFHGIIFGFLIIVTILLEPGGLIQLIARVKSYAYKKIKVTTA